MKQEINSLETNREYLKKEINLLQIKKNEVQNEVMEINKVNSKKGKNMSNISHTYEEKLKAQQEKIDHLEVL